MAFGAYLFIEGSSHRPRGLFAKLGDDQRLAKLIAAVHVAVDPPLHKAELLLLPRLEPGIRPDVDGAKVQVGNAVVAHKVAALHTDLHGIRLVIMLQRLTVRMHSAVARLCLRLSWVWVSGHYLTIHVV